MSDRGIKIKRVLAVAPSTRGFGFALVEPTETLVDWGVKTVKGDKNRDTLARLKGMITHYAPTVIALQNSRARKSRRHPRVRALTQDIIALASAQKIKVALFTREQIKLAFLGREEGTKYAIAELLAKRFPQELGFRLPRRRRPWMSEDYRMDIFDSVALGLAACMRKQRAGGN